MYNSVIAIGHKIGAGKDTFAGFLSKSLQRKGYETHVFHFAKPLKDTVIDLFDLSPDDLYTVDGKNKVFKYNPKLRNRDVLQIFGTDVARKIDDNVWVRETLDSIKSFLENGAHVKKKKQYRGRVAIIADLRFYKEYMALKDFWYKADNLLDQLLFVKMEREGYKYPNQQHISEWDLSPYPYLSLTPIGIIKFLYNWAIKRKMEKRHIDWDVIVKCQDGNIECLKQKAGVFSLRYVLDKDIEKRRCFPT